MQPTLVCFTELFDISLWLSAMFELSLTSFRLFVGLSFKSILLPLKCKSTHKYVLEPPSLPLARVTTGVQECDAIYGLCCLGKFALVAWDWGVIAGLEPVLRVETVSLHLWAI